MKRHLAKFATVLVVAILLFVTGCNSSSSSSDNGGTGGKSSSGKKVTITYWQYTYPSKVTEIKKLVKKFEAENPNIKVVAQDYPYDQYQDKIFAAQKAGNGPDIMNLYYGWIPKFASMSYIQPLPNDFMSADDMHNFYADMVQPQALDGKYYSMPIAVRSLALFYNKDLFKKASLDPNSPPKTWDELIADAKKMTVIKSDGRYQQEGFAWNASGQGLHTFEEVILRQFGVTPYSKDGKTVQWNNPGGLDAFKYWVGMSTKDKIGTQNFGQNYNVAFISGRAAMMIDGSFRIGDVKKGAKFNWGVAELPTRNGIKSDFASYWTNAIAKGVSGDKLKASEKFLNFLASPDSEKDWMKNVGELPAAKSLLDDPSLTKDPVYGPFIKGLKYAHATFFVDESKERDVIVNGINEIMLKNADVTKTFNDMVKQEQKIRDDFFSKN